MAYSKIRQHRGRKNCGGHKKKRRGAGNRGGRGNAGLSKHKWTWVTKNDPKYFSKPSMKPKSGKAPVLNLSQVNSIALSGNKKALDLSIYKILGRGNISQAVTIKALSFSKKAVEKITAVGGKTEALYATETEPEQESKVGESGKKEQIAVEPKPEA
jgi:large subunit ribosomal protein L15